MTKNERFAISVIIAGILIVGIGYGIMYSCCKIIMLIINYR